MRPSQQAGGVASAGARRRRGWGVGWGVLCAGSVLAALMLGSQGLALQEIWRVMWGEAQPLSHWLVTAIRLPRALTALGAGALLGMSGALFQSITRNPLGSPDIIGLTAGASAGAVAVSALWPGLLPLSWGAMGGGIAAMALVWLGAGGRLTPPHRMVVAGIAVTALAFAFVQFGLSSLRKDQAAVAAVWLNGSLASRTWADVGLSGLGCLLLLPWAAAMADKLRMLEMGDDLAQALGVRPAGTRGVAVLLAVLAAATAVSVAGPVAFIALAAPQIARRCLRAPGATPLFAALVGAALLGMADLCARHIGDTGLPVGVLTAVIGGVYLACLLIAEWRRVSV